MADYTLIRSSPFLLFAIICFVPFSSGFQFDVGEEGGWKKPTGKEPKTYNEWAAQNRFRIGDTLRKNTWTYDFEYVNDSVLLVSSADYLTCNTENPISKFDDGSTFFQFDRSGFFYFISGEDGHCASGQRLIVRVLHPSEIEVPAPAPVPAPSPEVGGGGDRSPPEDVVNSAAKMGGVASLMTGVGAVVYLFM